MFSKIRVNLKYIKEKAEVSYVIISLAFSGKGSLNDSKRKEDLEIVSKLRYSIAKKSVSDMPLTAFVDSNSHINGFYMLPIEGIIDRVRSKTYTLDSIKPVNRKTKGDENGIREYFIKKSQKMFLSS